MNFLTLFLLPFFIGIIGGFSAIAIRKIIDLSTFFSYQHYYFIEIPIVFLITAFIINRFLNDTSNPTIEIVAKHIVLKKGEMDYKKGLASAVLTALNIGAGTPVGREGPIAKLGGALSALFLKTFKTKGHLIPLYVTCGVTSALAATFNAPIAAIVFGLEIIIGKINLSIITPLAVSSMTATIISREFLGDYPTFFVRHLTYHETLLLLIPVFGIIFGVFIVFFEFLTKEIENLYSKLKLSFYKKALISGIVVGVLLTFFPQSASLGYNQVTELFSYHFGSLHALVLSIVKLTALALTLAAGIFGGVFAPAVFIGAFLGFFVGRVFFHSPQALSVALIGTVAFTSGISRAPFRSTLIIIELTKNYQLTIPALLTSIITVYVSNIFQNRFHFIRAVLQKGFDLSNENFKKNLEGLEIKDFLKEVYVIDKNGYVSEILPALINSNSYYFPVVENNKLIGIISFRDIRYAKDINKKAYEIMTPNPEKFYINDSIFKVFEIMPHISANLIPVVDKNDTYLGMFDLEKFKKVASIIYLES
ncbi:chloride channel protein [Caminibacter sp.]